MNQFQDS